MATVAMLEVSYCMQAVNKRSRVNMTGHGPVNVGIQLACTVAPQFWLNRLIFFFLTSSAVPVLEAVNLQTYGTVLLTQKVSSNHTAVSSPSVSEVALTTAE